MVRLRSLGILLLAAALSACTLAPKYERPAPPVAAAMETGSIRAHPSIATGWPSDIASNGATVMPLRRAGPVSSTTRMSSRCATGSESIRPAPNTTESPVNS